ncbi:MAG: hypothetical protein JRI40_00365 [Deltaproteobacteria bacterium]|nr:hypothetical protein [Deltaproteobacteria bacterium]
MTRNRRRPVEMLVATIVLWILLCSQSISFSQPIIIDHTCTDLTKIPAYWINQAKVMFKISYGHTSHGSQIVTGMNLLKVNTGALYWFDRDGTNGGLSFHDRNPSGDLGNPDRTTWATRTQTLLDTSGCDRNMIMWSWCGQVDGTKEQIDTYLTLMNDLETDYPDVTFVYMTGHLSGTGEGGNVNIRNNQIRDYCTANNKILFDFADIESYDPDGNYFLNQGADDECDYDGGNWADEWCSAHSGECASCSSCAHSRCLNCQLKGKAFWWMMARIAGWVPSGDVSIDIKANGQDGPLIVSQDTPVSITVSLHPGSYDGPDVDWWIAAYVGSNWYSFIFPTGWAPGINLCGQAPLFDLPLFEILNIPLPQGDYAIYFAVDDDADSIPDGTWLDAVEVQVQ